jgi:hypothetical protein
MPDTGIGTADGKGNEPEPDAVTESGTGAPSGLWRNRSVRLATGAPLLVPRGCLLAGTTAGRVWARAVSRNRSEE